jgi:hypothetical protein
MSEENGMEVLFKTVYRISRLIENGKTSAEKISDAFSQSQFQSKLWLVEKCLENQLELGTVFLCGGWYATLFLDGRLRYIKARSFDLDPDCEVVSEEINKHLVLSDWRFKAATENIHNINYSEHRYLVHRKDGSTCELMDSPDTIVNTSCEHIERFSEWYNLLPKGKILILQSNNGFGLEGHVNCSKNLEDFSASTPLSRTLYCGEKQMPKFTRFMRIGYR